MSPSSLPSTLPTSSSPSHAPPPPPFLPFARAVPVAPSSPSLEPRRPATDPLPFARATPLLPFTRGREVDVVLPRPPELPSCPRQWKLHMSLLTSPREMQPLRRNQHAPFVLEVTEQLNDLSMQGELSASQEIVQAIPLSSRPYRFPQRPGNGSIGTSMFFIQLDPSEKLDPEVEDVLIDIAEDFFKSVTTFACSLAKHRKSGTLQAKDVLLHAERSWNIALPGFGGDKIKLYKKPIKKSMASEGNTKSSAAQAAAQQKNQTPKPPATGSP